MNPHYRMIHIGQMPLGLVGDTWDPGGAEFEKARTQTARAITRLAKTKVVTDQVMDWEVRSWLREKHYGDASMSGLIAAVNSFHNKEAQTAMGEKPRRNGRLGGVDLLAQELADDIYNRTMEEHAQAKGDSPIERIFYTALRMVAAQEHRSIHAVYGLDEGADLNYWMDVAESGDGHRGMTAFCYSQVQIAGWRVDFVIHYPVWRSGDYVLKRLIVECDGHDYHERTKDQAKRDRSRDRVAQYEGLPVFRFTGSEIWNDPQGCADEVLQYMESGPEAGPV